jgi:CBS domain-containing protein
MRASDPVNRVMSEPVLTIGPDDTVSELLRTFIAYPVHHLPVVEDRRVVGMLSSADLLKLEFFLPPPGPARDALLNDRFDVRRIMRTPVVTVTEHETIERAAEIMAKNGFHSVPVVNGDDRLIGIVTTTDLIHGCLRPSGGESIARSDRTYVIDARRAETLSRARNAVEANDDSHGIAAALLDAHTRLGALELVAFAAKRYLNAGQDERLHASLQKAIERIDRLESLSGYPALIGLDAGE